jgi:hypothetical protein
MENRNKYIQSAFSRETAGQLFPVRPLILVKKFYLAAEISKIANT